MNGRLIRYPEERALEDAAFGKRLVPTRIFALLLPIWCVEIEATVTDGEPYDLIDYHLERAIVDADLHTTTELAEFLALDETLVDRALQFLTAIGHTIRTRNRIELTDLGKRSVREKIRYVSTRKDRRKLYFDAFGSRPLTRPYYDTRTVTFSSTPATPNSGGPRFQPLTSGYGFRPEALAELVRLRDRERFNLPEGIDDPRPIGAPECVYLPAYVVRATEPSGRVTYLAYTQIDDEADPCVSGLCEGTPEIATVLETAERDAGSRPDQTRAMAWLEKRNLGRHRPVRTGDGMWRITLPGRAFDAALPLNKLGSFVVLGDDLFHVWCADERVRRRALLERADTYLRVRSRADPAIVREWTDRVARQLDLGTIDLPKLRTMAVRAGDFADLAAQLNRLIG